MSHPKDWTEEEQRFQVELQDLKNGIEPVKDLEIFLLNQVNSFTSGEKFVHVQL